MTKQGFIGSVNLQSHHQLYLLSCILCTAIFIFNFSYAAKIGYPPETTFINSLLFITYFVLNIIILIFTFQTQKKENELKNQVAQHQQLTKYMENLENINKNMRAFKHDYMNILSTIRGFIIDDDMKKLRDFFEEQILTQEHHRGNSIFEIGKLSNLLILELKGLLYTKIIEANTKEIDVNVDIPYPVTSVSIDIIDLSRILGVFLDNAIEANSSITKRQINIAILHEEESVSIIIGNNCAPLSIPISRIDNAGITTKGADRGYGLNNVSLLLKIYPKVLLFTHYKNNYFEQRLEHL